MLIDLKNKRAVVTGSTAGIGFAIAKGLAASGAHVVINGRTREKVEAAKKVSPLRSPTRSLQASPPTSALHRVSAILSGRYRRPTFW